MSQDSESFLKLLENSRLLSPAALRQFLQSSQLTTTSSRASIAKALVDQKLITSFHAEILLAGRDGPFSFGAYLINGRYDEGPLSGQFKARHLATQHPVLLRFFPGQSLADLALWQQVEQQVAQGSAVRPELRSPFVAEFYETVVMPSYRFVVAQRPDGVTLQERLPRKARLPWKDACTIFAQIAKAVEWLHEQGQHCGSLSAATIWVSKSGFAQFRPELCPASTALQARSLPEHSADTSALDSAADWTRFGAALFRVLYGKPMVKPNAKLASAQPGQPMETDEENSVRIDAPEILKRELAKHELPEPLTQLLTALLFPERNLQLPRPISEFLSGLANKPLANIPIPDEPTLSAFRNALFPFAPAEFAEPEEFPRLQTGVDPVPEKILPPILQPIPVSTMSSAPGSGQPSTARAVRKKKWVPIAITLACIWIFCGLLGVAAYMASQRTVPGTTIAKESDRAQTDPSPAIAPTDLASDSETDATIRHPEKSLDPDAILVQKLVADDRAMLWESPTLGGAFELDGLPPSPKLVIALRPAALLQTPEGELLLRSLGPDFDQLIAQWETLTGTPLNEIEQLVVSLHSNENFRYEWFGRCRLARPIEAKSLLARWKNPSPQAAANDRFYYATEGQSHGFIVFDSKPPNEDQGQPANPQPPAVDSQDTISRFGIGNLNLVKAAADSPLASGNSIMQSLAERTDSARHLNVLYLRPALFNDEGQALMAGKWSGLNRVLAEIIPDEIQGGSFSLHLDQGTFLELQFAQTVDLRAGELKQLLEERFRALRDRANESIASIPASPYWDRVRLKLNLMSVDAFRSLRWGIEQGEVIANSWLPPMAAHNLVAAIELAVSFSGGTAAGSSSSSADAARETPKTLEELLSLPRDLKVANPPDLNLLMSDLESEINDEFPGLPFRFRIQLMGPDLQVEGITQNQRPAELNLEQQSLSEILTSVMVSANPAKDISGPRDPRCKLVWAIADDPEQAGQKIIVITTRTAAQQKNYQLPAAFQLE